MLMLLIKKNLMILLVNIASNDFIMEIINIVNLIFEIAFLIANYMM